MDEEIRKKVTKYASNIMMIQQDALINLTMVLDYMINDDVHEISYKLHNTIYNFCITHEYFAVVKHFENVRKHFLTQKMGIVQTQIFSNVTLYDK